MNRLEQDLDSAKKLEARLNIAALSRTISFNGRFDLVKHFYDNAVYQAVARYDQ
jgi:hypothetical protein